MLPSESIQPIVLVGGKSRRFGRDKLQEPLEGGLLVEKSIRALREVFGPCVALVGHCDPRIARLGDKVIPDLHAGRGPAGGILGALDFVSADGPIPWSVFVLPGDLPNIRSELIRAIVLKGTQVPGAAAVLARTSRGPEPCIGIYRQACKQTLTKAIPEGESRTRPLRDLLRLLVTETVHCTDNEALTANHPSDLARSPTRKRE